MLLGFIVLSISSTLIGIAFGLLCSIVLKVIPKLEHQPVKECIILFVFAYMSYLFAENFQLSGIITLFCCGFTMAHYAYYNISADCKIGSAIAVETAASIAESFLYVYLGLSAISI